MTLPQGYSIRLVTNDELVLVGQSFTRENRWNGRDGPYFSPHAADSVAFEDDPARLEKWHRGLSLAMTDLDFLRLYGLCVEGSEGFVGHVGLHGPRLDADRHRVSVGIGIEREHHRRGCGRALMLHAIEVAKAHGFTWMDLGVFTENHPAVALYLALGFVETGRVIDRFRVNDVSLGDTQMSLKLR